MAPTLVLASIKNAELEQCSPNLMPFHIDYSGPAPVSTYLRVEPANEAIAIPPKDESPNDDVTTEVPSDSLHIPVAQNNAEKDAKPLEKPPTSSTSLIKRFKATGARFITSFRGRTIHGLKVELPPGYVGLVLQADGTDTGEGDSATKKTKGKEKEEERENARAKAKAKGKATKTKGRVTRSSAQVIDLDEQEKSEPKPDAMDVDESRPKGTNEPLQDEAVTRTLVPSSQFSSFVLWHPDRPVDETKDEYYRSLTEWIQLAHEIHKIEEMDAV